MIYYYKVLLCQQIELGTLSISGMRWQSFNAISTIFIYGTIKGAICLKVVQSLANVNIKHAKLQTSRFNFAETVAKHVQHKPKTERLKADDQAHLIILIFWCNSVYSSVSIVKPQLSIETNIKIYLNCKQFEKGKHHPMIVNNS